MKTKLKRNGIASTFIVLAVFLMSFIIIGGWKIPATDAAKKNPVKSDANSKAAGKAEYTKSCKMCHGITGTGNGKMAGGSNFTAKTFKGLSDGAIFYQINTGLGKMPSYKTKIPTDKGKWDLVNYLRSL